MIPQLQSMLQQAIQAFQDGNLDAAEVTLKRILQFDSKSLPALHILGLIKASQASYKEAVDFLSKAARIQPKDASIQYNLAKALSDCGLDKESITHHKKALELSPMNPEAWLNYGKTMSNLSRHDEAVILYDKALSLEPNYAQAALNKGAALNELGRHEEAIPFAERAIELNPNLVGGWMNKGVALQELKRYEEAIAHYDQALSLKPDYHEAWRKKGAALQELKRYEEVIAHYDQALSLKPDYHEAWCIKGAALQELKRYEEAIAHYDQALSLKDDIDWLYGVLVHAKMNICSWSGTADLCENIVKKVSAGEKAAIPFALLTLSDDASLHKKSAEMYVQAKYPFNSALGPSPRYPARQKIRIGYFSADLRNHPVAFLLAQFFDIRDRSKFETYAFSLVAASDEMRGRLVNSFDHFIDAEDQSDIQIAQLARSFGIDIAVDLTGHTNDARTGIFSYRAAPIQVNWLGYPGTLGGDYFDYIVADKVLIPEQHQAFYTEKVAYLPDTYLVDDSKRVASSRVFTREECGLAENALVFCCFNNSYKFNPQVLDSWSRILKQVENSILWISENNAIFRANIIIEFTNRGIDPKRVIFAQRLESMADHLARFALADLFLDTRPYNAHTTAVDSLKAGVPVLTLIGQSFASRVAASLLNAIGLPELVTSTQEEYEALAIELALNSQKLADIKLKLAQNRLSTPLFDTPLFTKNLEAAYTRMYERDQLGMQPDHLFIP